MIPCAVCNNIMFVKRVIIITIRTDGTQRACKYWVPKVTAQTVIGRLCTICHLFAYWSCPIHNITNGWCGSDVNDSLLLYNAILVHMSIPNISKSIDFIKNIILIFRKTQRFWKIKSILQIMTIYQCCIF